MTLEQQRDDITDRGAVTDATLDDAYHLLGSAKYRLDSAMREMPDQVQRTLVSTAYDLAEQARSLVEQIMVLRGTEPTRR